MPYQTRLADALRAEGLVVEEVAGWRTRGASTLAPRGAVCHWTAGAAHGDRPSLYTVTYGRKDLPGPLCNVFLARSGAAVVVAAGRANHAGTGGARGLTGNSSVFGTEAESTGRGDWTPAQRWAYPRVNAAYARLAGFDASWVFGHNEWAPGRKIDIRDWDMPAMRAQVAAVLAGGTNPPQPPIEEDDMFTDADRALLRRNAELASWTHSGLYYGSKTGGQDYPGLIPAVLGDALEGQSLVNRIWNRLIHRTGGSNSVIQEIADIRTHQAEQIRRDAERDALLAAIAAKVGVDTKGTP
jgi:hypothetical protein